MPKISEVGARTRTMAALGLALAGLLADDASYAADVAPTAPRETAALAGAEGPYSVFVFGGQYTTRYMSQSYFPFSVAHEDQYVVGGAVGRDLFSLHGWAMIGLEGGIAQRFGLADSTEGWAGGQIRYTGPQLFDFVRVTPALTVGMSAVTKATGVEARREADRRGDAHLLGYLGPEIALSLPSHPGVELVYRLHHRSGAGATFGHMFDAANANVLGLRYRF